MTVVACVKSHVISETSLQLIEFVHVSSAKHQSGTDRWSVRHRCPHMSKMTVGHRKRSFQSAELTQSESQLLILEPQFTEVP